MPHMRVIPMNHQYLTSRSLIEVEDPECRTDCDIVLEEKDDFQIDKKLLLAEIGLPKK